RGVGDADPNLASCRRLLVHSVDQTLYAVADADRLFRFDPKRATWDTFRADVQFRRTAEVMVADEFWTWSRWGSTVAPELHRAGIAPAGSWPLLVDGTFSFDIVRAVCVLAGDLMLATAGGVVRLDPANATIRALDRVATDDRAGHLVPMLDGESFHNDAGAA